MNEKIVEPRYIPSIHLIARNRRPMIEQGAAPMSRENAQAWIDQKIGDRTDRIGFIHKLGSNS